MRPWAVYTRLSQDRTGEQTATERQEQACRAFATAKGFTIGDVYSDVDVSAYRAGIVRTDFLRLVGDVKAGRWEGVLCWKLDRLVRSHRDFEDLWEACETSGAGLASATEPVDSSSELGMIVVRLLVSFARMESANISLRVKAVNQAKIARGEGHVSGQRAFGINREWTDLVPEEADLLRDAARRVLQGTSVNSIAVEWNARGITTTTGRPWQPFTLARILKAPHIAGLRVHDGQVAGPGSWPAIIDVATHERLASRLLVPSGPKAARKLLSGGLLRCGLCGSQMMSRPREDKRPRYVCRRIEGVDSCGKVGILAEPLEDMVRDDCLEALVVGLPQALAQVRAAQPEREALAEQMLDIEQRLEQLGESFWVNADVPASVYWPSQKKLEGLLGDTKRRLRALDTSDLAASLPVDLDGLHGEWERSDLHRRRALLALVVAEVRVGPAVHGLNRFDPRRVSYVWAS